MREADDRGIVRQWPGLVIETVSIDGTLIRLQVAPPEDATVFAGGGEIPQLIGAGCVRLASQGVMRLEIESLMPGAADRPAVIGTPDARQGLILRARSVCVLQVDDDLGIRHDAGVTPLQPVVEPTHGLVAPFI